MKMMRMKMVELLEKGNKGGKRMGGKKVKVRDEREERGPTSSRADRRCAGAGVEASELSS